MFINNNQPQLHEIHHRKTHNLYMATFKPSQVFVLAATHGSVYTEVNWCHWSLKIQKVDTKWDPFLVIKMHSHREMIVSLIAASISVAWQTSLLLSLVAVTWFLVRLKTSGEYFKSHIKAIFENKRVQFEDNTDCCHYFEPCWIES